jgi:hypothetical protein
MQAAGGQRRAQREPPKARPWLEMPAQPCHRVTLAQRWPAPVFDPDERNGVAAPSFMKIACDPRNTANHLRQIIKRPHYPMREQTFDKDDLDAIVAYTLSLRSKPASW